MNRTQFSAFPALALTLVLIPGLAHAHVSVASGLAFSNTTQEVTFGVGHGCEGADTYRVQVDIPEGITSVRPETSGFGQVDVETDAAGAVVSVSWQKPDADVLAGDTQYYKLTMRLKTPDRPFASFHFPAHQTCMGSGGATTTVEWVGLDETDPDVEPAPTLYVVPPRFAGWNKYTVPVAVDDLGVFFGDAQIVWSGSAAYSKNPSTAELILATDGASSLASLAAGDQIWVRY